MVMIFYKIDHVEGASADGSYIKSNVQKHFNEKLGVSEITEWFPFQWDIPHRVNLYDEKAQNHSNIWKRTLSECQSITKLFRWGKEYQGLF